MFEIEVREIQTANQEMIAKFQAMEARSAQLDAETKRWQRLPGEDVTSSLALENLLMSQARLADAEFEFLQSQLTYNLAQMNLKRSTGLLLQTEGVSVSCSEGCDIPIQILDKQPTGQAVSTLLNEPAQPGFENDYYIPNK